LPDICDELATVLYDRPRQRTGEDLAWAFGVLAHETEHLVSSRSEAETECHGMQRVDELALSLGVSKAAARMLARSYWEHVYPKLLPKYRTRACREGGALDIAPASSVWP